MHTLPKKLFGALPDVFRAFPGCEALGFYMLSSRAKCPVPIEITMNMYSCMVLILHGNGAVNLKPQNRISMEVSADVKLSSAISSLLLNGCAVNCYFAAVPHNY